MALTKKVSMPIVAGMAVAIGLAGGSGINSLTANAATASDSNTTTAASTDDNSTTATAEHNDKGRPPQGNPSKGGHVGSNGNKEELLSGETAAKVKVAALEAVPGGTVQRVETDAEGAAYEAHVTKADGSQITVKFDGSFKLTSTEDGMR